MADRAAHIWRLVRSVCYTIVSTITSAVSLVLYYTTLAILFILTLLYRPVTMILKPFVHLGKFLLACLALPFSLLATLEDVYVFLGVAAIVGVAVGLVFSRLYSSLHRVLRLDHRTAEAPVPGPTGKQYREAKRKQKMQAALPALPTSPLSPNAISPGYTSLSDGTRRRRRGRGLLDQTILEEVDSDY